MPVRAEKNNKFASGLIRQRQYLMIESYKKYISPGAWFTMSYPAVWNEFEDTEGSFLFYNPNAWTGNFRISAYRGDEMYGRDSIVQELKDNPDARKVQVGPLTCAYSKEDFEEDGVPYTTHFWITGRENTAFECSFTVRRGEPTAEAETVISSLQVRREGQKYPAELIPVRVSEIYQIDEAYEWVVNKVKEMLNKDFQGMEEDVVSLQQLVDKASFSPKKREVWLSLGIALCVIMANETDGWEWQTLIDGNREIPVLMQQDTARVVDPMKLVWSRVRVGEEIDLPAIYAGIL